MIERAISSEERYPDGIRDLDCWIVWAFDNVGRKRPRAPWITETSYPVSWGKDADVRPETSFEEANRWAGFGRVDLRDLAPFPDDEEDARLKLGIILPHEPPEPPIAQVDLDDVRDPDTGEINEYAQSIIERLDAYTMISVSGTGIHCYVRAALPDRMGKFVEPFDLSDPMAGQIEIYDHGRFAAITGAHVDGTPTDVPERQSEIEEIIQRYETRKCEHCNEVTRVRDWDGDRCPSCEEENGSLSIDPDEFELPSGRDRGSSAGRSPYYLKPVWDVAMPPNAESTSEGWGGAHPGHGATSPGRDDSESTNFAINKGNNVWYCFAHDSGGGALALVGVLEGMIDCRQCKDGRTFEVLDDEEFLDLCLAARDKYGFSGEPPYRALVGVAKREGLGMANREEGILGKNGHKVASMIYEQL